MIDPIIEQFTQYYASDWIAITATFIWLWQAGNKQRSAFLFAIVASLGWLVFGWLNFSVASVGANSIFIILNIRGYYKWAPNNQ